ncbi:hypothetical protein FPE01S_01_11730 [Flavihumibacter petaseus NBRC 106054]|uniref:Lipocalin-like domain-containing protein n=2 Tax=Flavihumibacter TaxID=1004301 RepID=A0A0E9MYF4_9BACT|nr:hypothetical protein FPE01S_01_11730 [Flavihumibacter petaseus NBRC 106054]
MIETFSLEDFSSQWRVVKGPNNVGNRFLFHTSNVDSIMFTGDLSATDQNGPTDSELIGNFIKDQVSLRYLPDNPANGYVNGENQDKTYEGILDRSKTPYSLRLVNKVDGSDSLVIVQLN